MAYTTYMNYIIYISDPSEYAFAIGVAGGNFIEAAPRMAAVLFGIPHPYPVTNVGTTAKGIMFQFPFTPGAEFRHPMPSGIFVDDAVNSQVVPGQAGNPPSIWPQGQDGIFIWSGTILKSNGGGSSPTETAIPRRRWIGGKEMATNGEGGTAASGAHLCRQSSRTLDGFGHSIRGQNINASWSRAVNEYRPTLEPATSWERFYIRIRTLPTVTNTGVWRCHGFPSAAAGCGIKVTTGGVLEVFNISAGGVEVSKGSIGLSTGIWHKVDIFLKYGSGVGTDGRISVYLNGDLQLTFTDGANQGMNSNVRHTTSELGRWTGSPDSIVEIDLDDWICADLPGNVLPTNLSATIAWPLDWLVGSHVRLHYTEPSTVDITDWAGNPGVFNQATSPQTENLTSRLTSVTPSAVALGTADAQTQDIQDTFALVIGAVAAIVSAYNQNNGSTDGQLGYSKAGGASVDTVINQINALQFNSVAYLPSGMIVPDEISPWAIAHIKSADASNDITSSLATIVEYIGIWGPEDDPTFDIPLERDFRHNNRYTNTVWGYLGPISDAPVFAVGDIYVGNSTYQEIVLPAPVHMLWIRPLVGGTGGVKWFSCGQEANFGAKDRTIPHVRVWNDFLTGETRFSVNGPDVNWNQSGVTYQYIAFCDPGMRFSICGAYQHPDAGGLSSYANLLPDPGFLPEGAFVQANINNLISNITGLWYKGPGTTLDGGQALTGGAPLVNFGHFTIGTIHTMEDLNLSYGNMNYMVFRSSEPVCTGIMVQMMSYTGDGTGIRTIPVTPACGRFPLLAVVIPNNGQAIMRDPSHTGNGSCVLDTLAPTATGIISGDIDEIEVAAALNTLGVLYQVFIIPGDVAGWNNGIFYNPNCAGNRGPLPRQPIGINLLPNGGLLLDGQPATALLQDISGIYTVITNKTEDSLIDRQSGQPNVDVKIPDPTFKTGYFGG